MAASTLTEAKPRQLQISRLRREEEEETWISGEELNTEGSSDDEAHSSQTSSQTRHRNLRALERRISAPPNLMKWQLTLKESSEPVIRDEPHLTETTRRLSQMEVVSSSKCEGASLEGTKEDVSKYEVEEQEEVMLWRPKWGSMKIPRIDIESTTTRSTEQKVTG